MMLKINAPGNATEYLRTENFATGEVAARWMSGGRQQLRRMFVSRPDNVVVLSLAALTHATHLPWQPFAAPGKGGASGMAVGLSIALWNYIGWAHYDGHPYLIATTVGLSLIGVVTFGSVVGSMLPFILRRLGFDPATASAPFVATLVDVTGLVIYFTVALILLRGTLL